MSAPDEKKDGKRPRITLGMALPEAGVPDAQGEVYSEEAVAKMRERLASGDVPVTAEPGVIEELEEQRRRWAAMGARKGAGVGIAGRVDPDDIEVLPDGTRVIHRIDLHSIVVVPAERFLDKRCRFLPAHEHKTPPIEGEEEADDGRA